MYHFDFLYTKDVAFAPMSTTSLHALTRAGKTTRKIEIGTTVRDNKTPMIPLLFTDNSRAGLADAKVKAVKHGWDEDSIIFLNKDKHLYLFLEQIRGFNLSDRFFFMANSDYHHYDRIIKSLTRSNGTLSEGIHNVPVLQMEDEAHRGRDSVHKDQDFAARHARLRDLQKILKSHVLFSSATLERDAFSGNVNQLCVGESYVYPTEAENRDISVVDGIALRKKGDINPWIPYIKSEISNKPQSLTLINGVFGTNEHERIVNTLKYSLPHNSRVGILLINRGQIKEIAPDRVIDDVLDCKDAQSAIHSMYHERGYRHIICVGHKQAELGQTFADHSGAIWLTTQIIGTSVSDKINEPGDYKGYRSQYHSIAQWVRTGGYTVKGHQTVFMPKRHWESYKLHAIEGEKNVQSVIDQNWSYDKMSKDYVKRIIVTIPDTLSYQKSANSISEPTVSPQREKEMKFVTEFIKWKKPLSREEFKKIYPIDSQYYVDSNIAPKISIKESHGKYQAFKRGIRIINHVYRKHCEEADIPYKYHRFDNSETKWVPNATHHEIIIAKNK